MDIFSYKIAEIISKRTDDDSIILKLLVDRSPVSWNTNEMEVSLQVSDENLKYDVGTLVKFTGKTPQSLHIVPTDNFDYLEFHALERRMPLMSCDELIAIHQKLKDKYATDDIHSGLSFYEHFIFRILDLDLATSISKETNPELFEFYNSKYMSDYLKDAIKAKVTTPNDELLDIINSDKTVSEFTEDDFFEIFKSVQYLKDEDGKNSYLPWAIIALAFKLDTTGAKDFLNNKINSEAIIKRIVRMSGFNNPEYYYDRTINPNDINSKKIKAVYDNLERLDEEKALSMAKMTMKIEKLYTCDFLISLYNLASADFNLDDATIFSLDPLYTDSTRANLKELLTLNGITALFMPLPDTTDDIKEEFKNLLPTEVAEKVSVSQEENCSSAFFKPCFSKKK